MRHVAAILLLLAPAMPGVARGTTSIQTIWLVHTSHWDYGFTDPPQNLAGLLRTHLNNAVARCLQDPRHRYTIEHTWALEEYLSVASPAEIEALLARIRSGQIAVSSGYGGPHSGIMSPEELNRWMLRNRRLRDRRGFTSRSAHLDDNPGYTWGLPDAFAGSGVDRVVCGLNYTFASPFPFPKSDPIFRWQGPGGGEVLTWVSPDGYFEGAEFWQIDPNVSRFFFSADHPEWATMTNLQIMEQGISARINALESAGYPYDSVLVLEAFDIMDYDPSNSILQSIDAWNASHTTPQIRLATADEFFDHMVATYGLGTFPVQSGNWTQRWEETKAYSQTVQSRFRELQDAIPAAEKFAAAASRLGSRYPAATLELAMRDLMRFDDHGAGCGATQPLAMTFDQMNATNLYWTQTSRSRRDEVRAALGDGVEAVATRIATMPGTNPEIVVFNPLSFERTAVATATVDTGGQPFALRDVETGAAIPYQPLANGSIQFVAEEVPPIGYRRIRVLVGSSDTWSPGTTVTATSIENAYYRVTIDPDTGAILGIVDKPHANRQLVNTASTLHFNRTVRANNLTVFLGGAPRSLIHRIPVVTSSVGPVSGNLTLTYPISTARTGSPLSRVEIRLYDRLKRLDIVNTMDRTHLLYEVTVDEHSEHFYSAMPFAIPIAGLETIVDGNANAPLRPPTATYLTGPSATAVNNTHLPTRGVTLRDAPAAFEVQVVSPQIFDYAVGTTVSGVYAPAEATLLAQCMTKQDRTKTDDPGYPDLPFVLEPLEDDPSQGYQIYTSQFSLTSGAPRSDAGAGWWGASISAPVSVVQVPGGQSGPLTGPARSLFSVDAPNVEILAVKRPDFGDSADVVVRLRERDGVATVTTLRSAFPVLDAAEATLLEEPGAALPVPLVPVTLGPYQTRTVRLRLGPLDGREPDTVGVYAPGSGAWFLRNTNTPGPADVTFGFGPPGAIPVTGDWDGDGVDTVGIFDASTSTFFLKNSAAGGDADTVASFGPPGSGWTPLTGDWNGDGIDTVGLYDPDSGTFFLRNQNAPGPADVVFGFGLPGVVPVTGDWNGDGVDTVGIYAAASGAFFLANGNVPGPADLVFVFGAGGATPLAGDWDGDGIDTVGLYLGGSFFLRNGNSSGPADRLVSYGPPGVTPLRGNWDGN